MATVPLFRDTNMAVTSREFVKTLINRECSGNKYTLEAIWNTTVDLLTHPIFKALAIVCYHLV